MPWNRLDEDGSPLDRWQTVVDQAIAEAQERGEFDDLPGAGKPLQLEENPFAGDSALGFRVLKNAGMAPPWIEADREMSAASSSLDAVLDRARREFARSHEQESPTTDTRAAPPSRRFRFFPWRSAAPAPVASRIGGSDLEPRRQRGRRAYLDEAAAAR